MWRKCDRLLIKIFLSSVFLLHMCSQYTSCIYSGVPRNFVRGGGSINSVEDRGQRERGYGGGSPLVRGSGGSCDLVQEISFPAVKFS